MPSGSLNLHTRSGDSLTAKHRTLPDKCRSDQRYTEFDITVQGGGTWFYLGLFTESPDHLRALALVAARAARDLEVAQLAAAFEAEHPEYCLLCPCEPTDYVQTGHRDGCPYHCEYCTKAVVDMIEAGSCCVRVGHIGGGSA